MPDAESTSRSNKLFEPFELAGVTLRNRVVFPAMLTNFATDQGFATQRTIAFYRARARGGAGLIIIEATTVSPEGRATPNMLAIHDDDYLPDLTDLVNAVRDEDARLFIQLTHAGRETTSTLVGAVPVAPSPLPGRTGQDVPQELDSAGINRIIADFVAAASRARDIGFDGVQICAGRDHLIHQFLSTESNRRSDDFGGEFWGRARFLREIVDRTRKQLGSGFPILVRMPRVSERRGGLSAEELKELARMLEVVGASAVEVGQVAEVPLSVARLVGPDGRVARSSPARLLKEVLAVPVIDEGNVRDLDEAAHIIERGQADLVAMGRPLITEPDLVVKADSEPGEPRPCIYNNVCRGAGQQPAMRCPANPAVGREQLFAQLPRVTSQKRIAILGAGLAGLQIASLAARVGFQVTLHEPSGILGGLTALRARIPVQSDNYRIIDFLSRSLVQLNVKLKLRSDPGPDRLLTGSPYAVFVTRRGALLVPDVTGLANVRAVDPTEVLAGEVEVGDKVCVIGGGLLAAEVAYFLALRKKNVTLVNQPRESAGYEHKLTRRNLGAFRAMEGHVINEVSTIEINIYGEVTVVASGRTQKIRSETIVLASGYETADDRYNRLGDALERFFLVGDAYESGRLTNLVYQGTQTVLDLADECAGHLD